MSNTPHHMKFLHSNAQDGFGSNNGATAYLQDRNPGIYTATPTATVSASVTSGPTSMYSQELLDDITPIILGFQEAMGDDTMPSLLCILTYDTDWAIPFL